MDLKKLLLMQRVIPIVQFMCLQVKKKRYSIHYVIKDNILRVENIKRIYKRTSLRCRYKIKKKKFIHKIMRYRAEAIRRCQLKTVRNIGVGTNRVQVRNVYTSTSKTICDNYTNTRSIISSNAVIQTEVYSNSLSTQCTVPTHEITSQTDNSTNSMGIQTDELFTSNKASQTYVDDCLNFKEFQGNFEDVSNMLNGVSQMVLHQNKLMNNNCTMLGYLTDIVLLKKFGNIPKETDKCVKARINRNRLHRPYTRPRHNAKRYNFSNRRKKELEICTRGQQTCTTEPTICLDAYQQTDEVEVKHKVTQTISKATFFPGFFKNPSSTKFFHEVI